MPLPIYLWQLLDHLLQPHPFPWQPTTGSVLRLSKERYQGRHLFAREDDNDGGSKWTTGQIITVVIIVLIVIVIFVVGHTVWYHWQDPFWLDFRSRWKCAFVRTRRVQSGSRSNTWNIDGPQGSYSLAGTGEPTLPPSNPGSVGRAAQRVKASVQGSVSGALRALPSVPWSTTPKIQSRKPRRGFNVDDPDTSSPVKTKANWPFNLMRPSNMGSVTTESSSSGSSGAASQPDQIVFGVERRSGSSFDIVDEPAPVELTEEEEEHASLLPRTPTTNSGSVMLISRNGRNFTIRTNTTSSGHNTSRHPSLGPMPISPPSSAFKFPSLTRPRPQPRPLPPVPTTSPPMPPSLARPAPVVYAPALTHQRSTSSSSGSEGLKRKSALSLRQADSRHTSSSSLSLTIPPRPMSLVDADQLTSLPSPGSPAYSGAATPVTPGPRDQLLRWQMPTPENFYQPFPDRSRLTENGFRT